MIAVEPAGKSPLLSPPSSPRMSTFTASPSRAIWLDPQNKPAQPTEPLPAFSTFPPIKEDPTRLLPSLDTRPSLLRSHKSFPHALTTTFGPSFRAGPQEQVAERDHFSDSGDLSSAQQPSVEEKGTSSGLTLQTRSVPTSPNLQLTPTSPENRSGGAGNDDDDAQVVDMDEGDDNGEGGDVPKTAAERRAEKRKMKRFRLSHTQTRYLMSEFARQAHPDAAHRERLSREIPGLSPRQVQVWFQNRRAKLKRLNFDDRERMLKSRALPDDFDMTQTLHSPRGSQPMGGTPMASPVSYMPSYSDSQFARPMLLGGLRRPSEDESVTSPMSMSSMYGNFYTPPTSDNVSPISTASDRNHFAHPSSQHTSPRAPNPFAMRSSSFSSAYQHPQIPRLQLHDRVGRARAESLQSPLRSSMSYTGNSWSGAESHPGSVSAASHGGRLPDEPQTAHPRAPTPSNPYGLGHNSNLLGSFQQTALSRSRPGGAPAPIPPGLQLRSDINRSRANVPTLSTPQPRTPSYTMQTAPLAPPPEYHFPQLSASYSTPTFGSAYSQHSASATPTASSAGIISPIGAGPSYPSSLHRSPDLQGQVKHEPSPLSQNTTQAQPSQDPSHNTQFAQHDHQQRAFTNPYDYMQT